MRPLGSTPGKQPHEQATGTNKPSVTSWLYGVDAGDNAARMRERKNAAARRSVVTEIWWIGVQGVNKTTQRKRFATTPMGGSWVEKYIGLIQYSTQYSLSIL